MGTREMIWRVIGLAQEAGRVNKGLRNTWPLLARDVIALLGGLRRAVMLDYAHGLLPMALADVVLRMRQLLPPAGVPVCLAGICQVSVGMHRMHARCA